MNSRERMAAAMRLGQPDRVPVMCQLAMGHTFLHGGGAPHEFWFDSEAFYTEVRRLARPGALFAAFTYGLVAVNAEVDAVIRRLYHDLLGSYWPPERRHVDEGYRSLPFPFREITPPEFAMGAAWQFDHLMGYLGTWSAVKEYRARTGADPLEEIRPELLGVFGAEGTREVSWPLIIRVGQIE